MWSVLKVIPLVLLSSIAMAEPGLVLGHCLKLPSFAERQSCLSEHIKLAKLQEELKVLTSGRTNEGQIPLPQPVTYLASKSVSPAALVMYEGGEVLVREGDYLAGGWKVVAITRTSVGIQLGTDLLYLGYGSGVEESSSKDVIPVPYPMRPPQ